MKVVVVLTQPPLHEGGAPGKAAIGLLRGLAAHGVEVRAIAARRPFAARTSPPADLPVEIVDVAEPGGWDARLARWRRPRGQMATPAFMECVRSAARGADVLHLEETETAWCSLGIDLPAVCHLHYLARLDRSFGLPWRRRFRDGVEEQLAETAAIRRHRALVASSPVVEALLRERAPRADVVLAPLSLDPAHYARAPLSGPPVAGIVGTAAWEPTARSARVLVDEVWPLVRARVPDARLRVAGRGMDALGLAGEGVEVLGEIASAAEFVAGLSVLVHPQPRGSGVKVKVLEAIACGVPVTTTPYGAEGIEAPGGVFVSTETADLVETTAALLADEGLRRRAGDAARAAFAARYAPERATRPLVELYERLTRGGARTLAA